MASVFLLVSHNMCVVLSSSIALKPYRNCINDWSDKKAPSVSVEIVESSQAWLELKERFSFDPRVQAIERAVAGIDLKILEDAYAGVGSKPHSPECMLRLALFEILDGRPSPAQWERDAKNNDPVKFLARMIQPSRSACYEFRDRASKFISQVHQQMIRTAIDGDLLSVETGVLDGTFFRSYASRHRMLSIASLEKRLVELKAAMSGDLVEAWPSWIAPTPNGRNDQLERYEQSLTVLKCRIEENSQRPKDKRLPEKRVLVAPFDPEAPIGKDKEKVFGPLYNSQFMIDPKTLLVLGCDVFPSASDSGTIGKMIDLTNKFLGKPLQNVFTDGGYSSVNDIKACQARNVNLFAPVQDNRGVTKQHRNCELPIIARDQFTYSMDDNAYTCPQGHKLEYVNRTRKRRAGNQAVYESRYRQKGGMCQTCPLAAQCLSRGAKARTIQRLDGQELVEELRAKMETDEGKNARLVRSQTVERGFADTKLHRGIRRFHCRTLARAKTEISLAIIAQNALTLFRLSLPPSDP
jgi:transposase